MARPLRIEFPNACYFVALRGNADQRIFLNSDDGRLWIKTLAAVCGRFGWICRAFCMMENRYCLVVETPRPNLSAGMRQLGGVYTQAFNRKHGRRGHLFMGRFRSVVFQKERYLKPLVRHTLQSPVRGGFVKSPVQWKWSSCRASLGKETLAFIDADATAEIFGSLSGFEKFVCEPTGDILKEIRHQIYLGDDEFIKTARGFASGSSKEIPFSQRAGLKSLPDFAEGISDKKEAICKAYKSGGLTMKEVARRFGVHYSTVSRIVSEYENSGRGFLKTG